LKNISLLFVVSKPYTLDGLGNHDYSFVGENGPPSLKPSQAYGLDKVIPGDQLYWNSASFRYGMRSGCASVFPPWRFLTRIFIIRGIGKTPILSNRKEWWTVED